MSSPPAPAAVPEVIAARRAACEERLETLRGRIASLPALAGADDLCIYATGSFGRLEASAHSDLDLFLVHTGPERYPRLDEHLVLADLVRACRSEGFPEFTDDGRYLEVHRSRDLHEHLGGAADVARNWFTARLLLLLESRPLHGEAVYRRVLEEVIGVYFHDYHEHEASFRPVFLANDVVRYWKTLCLSYEHARRRRDPARKPKSHLVNLKLKFSRMLTCYALLVTLAREQPLGPERLLELAQQPPLARLIDACAGDPTLADPLARALAEYAWFLEATGRPEPELLAWIAARPARDEAFARARAFGGLLFTLLARLAAARPESELLRYLVI